MRQTHDVASQTHICFERSSWFLYTREICRYQEIVQQKHLSRRRERQTRDQSHMLNVLKRKSIQHRRQDTLISMFLNHILLSQACARTSSDEIFNKAFTSSAFLLFIITFINSILSISINFMSSTFTFRSCHIRLSLRLHLSSWSSHHIFDVLDSYIALFTCSNRSHHHHLAFITRMWRVSHFMSYRYDFVSEEACPFAAFRFISIHDCRLD